MLEIKELSKKYIGTQALQEVSVTFQPGQIVGLLGENGAGKSTFMKCVLGFITPTKGSILLDNASITYKNYDQFAFATCEHSFFSTLTPKEHKEFYQMQFPRFNERRFDVLMDFFELPLKKKLKTFSTGQQNQFEALLALSQGANYIFMDEPFAGSDIFNRDDFYKVLLGILEPTETLILSTHLIEEIKHFIGRVVLLRKGSLVGDITTEELQEQEIDVTTWIKSQYNYKADRVIEALKQSKL